MQIEEVTYNGEVFQVWCFYARGTRSRDWREPNDPDVFEVESIWPKPHNKDVATAIGDLAYNQIKDG